jgi:hypothetical protein
MNKKRTHTSKTMIYREPLPTSCPPSNPKVPQEKVLWRLLFGSTVTDADFDSQREKQKTRKFPDECTARSVSLATSLAECRAMAKSPRLPNFTHAVPLQNDPATGVWDKDKPTHVNWWPYQSTNPLKVICGKVETL